MFEIFTTREIAIGIWAVVFFSIMSMNKQVRISLIRVVKSALVPRLAIPAIAIYLYATLFCFGAAQCSVWEKEHYKDVFMWVTFVGMPICFGAVFKQAPEYFKKAIIDNFKLTVLFEFVFSSFTYSLVAEMIIIFVVFWLNAMYTVANRTSGYKVTAHIIHKLLNIIYIAMLFATCKHAVENFRINQAPQMIISLIIPIVLSVLYIPISYTIGVYSNYFEAFIRMRFFEPQEKTVRFRHRIKAISACKFSIYKTRLLSQTCPKYMYASMPEEAFNCYMNSIKNRTIEHIGQ